MATQEPRGEQRVELTILMQHVCLPRRSGRRPPFRSSSSGWPWSRSPCRTRPCRTRRAHCALNEEATREGIRISASGREGWKLARISGRLTHLAGDRNERRRRHSARSLQITTLSSEMRRQRTRTTKSRTDDVAQMRDVVAVRQSTGNQNVALALDRPEQHARRPAIIAG